MLDLKAADTNVSLILSQADIFGNLDQRRTDKYSAARVLSILYAIILSLLGLVLPLSAVVEDEWLMLAYDAAFAVYIYSVGTLYVVYWEIVNSCCEGYFQAQEQDANSGPLAPPVGLHQLENGNGHVGNGHVDNGHVGNGHVAHSNGLLMPSTPTAPVRQQRKSAVFTLSGEQGPRSRNESEQKKRHDSGLRSRKISQFLNQPFSETQLNTSTQVWSSTAYSPVNNALLQSASQYSLANRKTAAESEEQAENTVVVDLAKLKNVFATHESNAYLRFALLVFSAGNIVFIILETYHYIAQLAYDCDAKTYGWTFIVRLIFTVCQSLFFFRGTKAKTLRKNQTPIIRFGLMHLIGTNVAVWFRTLINEMVHAKDHGGSEVVNTTDNGTYYNEVCINLDSLLATISPYLFPFVMEYSLIVLGMTAIMYGGLDADVVNSFKNLKYVLKLMQPLPTSTTESGKSSSKRKKRNIKASSWSIDSHTIKNSNIGAFLGGLEFTLMISCLIAAAVQDEYTASMTYVVADIVFNCLMIIACLMGHVKLFKNFSRVDRSATVDDFLLMIAMTGALFFELCVTIPTARYMITTGTSDMILRVTLAGSLLAMLQHVLQTIALLAAMRSYSDTRQLAMTYPARQILTFLAFSNVSMWIYHTFQWQQLQSSIEHDFSVDIWVFLLHLNLPFLLFFHFHSSVCFVDIWHSAYRPLAHRMEPCVVDVETPAIEDGNDSGSNNTNNGPVNIVVEASDSWL